MKENLEYTPEYFVRLGFTKEEAESLAERWNFKMPDNPQELERHVRKGIEWEREGRSALTDRRLERGRHSSKTTD